MGTEGRRLRYGCAARLSRQPAPVFGARLRRLRGGISTPHKGGCPSSEPIRCSARRLPGTVVTKLPPRRPRQRAFELGDLRETVEHAHGYDAVLLVSVGVLGSPEEVVGG